MLRRAFTLIEVTLSIAVLIAGLTAVVSIYLVAITWIEEIRIDLTAMQTGRAVLADAGILMDDKNIPLNLNNRSEEAKGWVNDYYVVRTYDKMAATILPNDAGLYVQVQVHIYTGGNQLDGHLAAVLSCKQILLKEYHP